MVPNTCLSKKNSNHPLGLTLSTPSLVYYKASFSLSLILHENIFSIHTLTTSWILATHVVVEAISSLAGHTVSLIWRPLEVSLASLVSPYPCDLTLPVLARLSSLPGHWGRLTEALTLLPPRALGYLRQRPLQS